MACPRVKQMTQVREFQREEGARRAQCQQAGESREGFVEEATPGVPILQVGTPTHLAVPRLGLPLSDLHPSFISFELAPLGSSFCPHVAQCPNICNSPWQVQGGSEEIANHAALPLPCHTQAQPLPRASTPGVPPTPPPGLGAPGLLAPEAAAGSSTRNASCSRVWSIRVTASSGATVPPRDKNTNSQMCIERLPALGQTHSTMKNRELTTHWEHG